MSLLNEVLRDIDQRRREARDQHIVTSVLVAQEQDKLDWFGPIVALVAILALGSLTYWAVGQTRSTDVLYSTFQLPSVSVPMNSEVFVLPQLSVEASTPLAPIRAIESAMLSTKPAQFAESQTTPVLTVKKPVIAKPVQIAQPTARIKNTAVIQNNVSITRDISQDPNLLVDHYLSNHISLEVVEELFSKNIYTWPAAEVNAALERISYGGRSIDDLANLLEMNRMLESVKGISRSESILGLYSQLRLKSAESGYWAFQQAVLLDKSGEARQAFYYYRQAVQSNHITARQRKLSELRVKQLRYEFR